jgi:hypothetical protein
MSKLSGFKPATKNANRHTKRGLAALEASIREDGYVAPITVAADGEALDGSARMEVVADLLDVEPIVIHHDGKRPVIMVRDDVATADSEMGKRIAVRANRVGQIDLEWDPAVLLAMPDELIESLFNPEELSALGDEWANAQKEHTMTPGAGGGYKFGEINTLKLAHRIEAAWRAQGDLAIDLFSGEGQLAWWYSRRFEKVVRVDIKEHDSVQHVMSAQAFLESNAFLNIADIFDFVDFDDEGSPLREVKLFFDMLPKERALPFVLCLTDGSGLNLKMLGKYDPALYGLPGIKRQARNADYEAFEKLVTGAVERAAIAAGWQAHRWSSVRGSENNVIYQTYLVTRADTLVDRL